MSGSLRPINIGIPDITVVVRENSDANKVLVDVPNISVNIENSPDYKVSVQPSSLVVQRTGSLPSLAVSALFANTASYALAVSGSIDSAISASYAQTASYALNAGAGSGFPFSGSAVITGSLQVLNTGSVGGITGSFTGSFKGDGSQLTGIATTLQITGSTGQDSIDLKTQGLLITGSNGIITTVTDNTVTIVAPQGTVTNSAQINVFNTTGGNNVATLGANTFNGKQTIIGGLEIDAGNVVVTSGNSLIVSGTIFAQNEFIAGFVSSSTIESPSITGSLLGTASVADAIDIIFAGSFETGNDVPIALQVGGTGNVISASYALTASYAANGGATTIPAGTISSSTQVQRALPLGMISSSTGVANYIPLWQDNYRLTNSPLYYTGSSIIFGGTSFFDEIAPDKLGIYAGNTTSFNLISAHATVNNYLQINLRNFSTGSTASSDFVATSDTGNETTGYVDMGINSALYSGSHIYDTARDAYLYTIGNNLIIGTSTPSASAHVTIFAGGDTYAAGKLRLFGNNQHQLTGSLNISGSQTILGNQTITGSLIHGLEGNIATGEHSHAEGSITKAIGNYSHAEGDNTQAKGDYSHAEGRETIASGSYSHAEGYQTIALANHQHVQGQYNAVSSVPSAFIVGNGTDDNNRSNLIHAAGNEVQITGSLTISGSSTFTNIGPSVFSGSINTINGITGSLLGTASVAQTSLTASYALNSITINTGSFATTGSNIFNNDQTITGSLYISQNLYVQGSSSISYVSQSTLNIGTNVITVNVQNPGTRFGGLSVIDSGSSPQRSGSLFFDSINDQWIFIHQNQTSPTSSILIMGPQTYNNIGNETNLTTNYIPKSVNAEHIGDSQISDNGTTVSITNGLSVGTSITATSITASVSGTLTGTFPYTSLTGRPSGLVSSSLQINTGSFSGSITTASFATTASTATSITFVPSTASFALTASYVAGATSDWVSLTNKPANLVSSSIQVKAFLPGGTVSASAQYPGWVTSSTQIINALPLGTVSSSVQVSNYNIFATTGSNIFNGNQIVTGSSTISGSLTVTAATIFSSSLSANSSSLVLNSGSNLYIQNNGIAEITGSLLVTGSMTITGGSLTMPNRPAFRVTGTGGATFAATVLSGSKLNTPDFNQGSHFNTTTGLFTAPVAGLYQVNLIMRTNSNTNSTINQAIVYKSSSAGDVPQIMVEFGVNTTMNHTGGSTITNMAVGDTLRAVIAVGTCSFDSNDNFSVAYIG